MTKHPARFSGVFAPSLTASLLASLTLGLGSAEADDVWSVPSPPPESSGVSTTSGLSLGVGVGYQTPVTGAQLAYDLRIADSQFTLAPWVGYGGWKTIDFYGHGDHPWHQAFAGGVMLEYGDHHRLVVDLAVAPIRFATSASLSCASNGCTESEAPQVTYGPTAALGYEYLSSGGFFVRPMLGANVAGATAQVSLGAKFF